MTKIFEVIRKPLLTEKGQILREKNVLSRADLEELSHKVGMRAKGAADGPLPCCPDAATAASEDMRRITSYLGARHGGKHARGLS